MPVNECGKDSEGENGILKKQICGKALDENCLGEVVIDITLTCFWDFLFACKAIFVKLLYFFR